MRKLSVFGSAARGEMKPESDVDLMLEFDPASKTSLWDYPAMQEDFSAFVRSTQGRVRQPGDPAESLPPENHPSRPEDPV